MSYWRGDRFQMQGSESETGLRVRSKSARATQRRIVRGALVGEQRIQLTKFAWIAECPQPAYSRG
jgi:hypothetical protein